MKLADYISSKPILESDRLRLRELEPSAIDDLRLWTANAALYRYWGKGPGKTDKNPELLFEYKPKPSKSFHWGMEQKDEGNVVGEAWVYLIESDRMAKLALRVAESYQRRGLASEAIACIVSFCFESTELRRLWTDVDVRNIGSQKALARCGFTREGHIRMGKMVSVWCDYYIYGILKEDYLSQTQAACSCAGRT